MSFFVVVLFSIIGIADLIINFNKICKKDKRIYIILFIAYQTLFVLAWLGYIPQHFSSIIKVW